METIIRDNMVEYNEDNKLINNSQHGFRSKLLCLINLLVFFYCIFEEYDEDISVEVASLDFQELFDKVLHKRLLSKQGERID